MKQQGNIPPASFAAVNADPLRGFRAVPRWFRSTEFWQSLEASHRAVIDQLYQQVASVRVVQHATGIVCERGQWAIGYEALGEASGTTAKVARRAVERAVHSGVIAQDIIVKRLPGRTLHISLFTWLDFNAYDFADGRTGTPPGTPVGTVRHHSHTPTQDTNPNTPAPAAPPRRGGDDGQLTLIGAPEVKPKTRKQPSGAHIELTRVFCTGWESRYGKSYTFRSRDAAHLTEILDLVGTDLAQATELVTRYLADQDGYLVTNTHPIGRARVPFQPIPRGVRPAPRSIPCIQSFPRILRRRTPPPP